MMKQVTEQLIKVFRAHTVTLQCLKNAVFLTMCGQGCLFSEADGDEASKRGKKN